MLIEIPDPEIILGLIGAFCGGLISLFVINKIKSSNTQPKNDSSSYDRLEFYERQLIDMKIRLDSMEISRETRNSVQEEQYDVKPEFSPKKEVHYEPKKVHAQKSNPRTNLESSNMVDFVLRLITDGSMTSRDIQNASQRSREHTSRLMKKLYHDGYVERNTSTKPYTYSITEKGKQKVGVLKNPPNLAA